MDRILKPIRTLLSERDLFIVLVCSLLLGLALSFVAPFYSMFGTLEVGMSNWVFGVFMTITSVAGIVFSTLLARWSDTHFSRRSVLLIGCLAGALGYGGYAFVRNVVWLTVIGSFGIGISSIVFAQVFAYGREALDRHGIPAADAPLYMNIYRLALSLAWTIGPGVAAWVMIRYSYQGIFLACGSLFVVFLAIVWLYVPVRAPNPAARRNPVPLLQLLRRPDILCYFSAFVLVFICMTMGMMNLPLMILQSLGGKEQQVGIAYSVAPFFELPFLFFFGLAAARGSKPVPMIRLGVIIGVAYYLLLSRVQTPWQVYPVQILSAAMVAIVSGIAITFFQNYIPNQPGTATNLYTTANRIGQTAGYLCYGTLASSFGHRAVFLVCAGVCIGAFVLLWLAREEHEANPEVRPAQAEPIE